MLLIAIVHIACLQFEVRREEDHTRRCYLRWFVKGDPYSFFGLFHARLRLFGFDDVSGVDAAGNEYFSRFYLLGSDISGRDVFSDPSPCR